MTKERPEIAVIGGSGFYTFFDAGVARDGDLDRVVVDTPYGQPSAPITIGEVHGRRTAFMPRHGESHEYSPHMVPYRANIWALRSIGVRKILAPCAAGSLRSELGPGSIVVPDQLVDRTSGRIQTYFDGGGVHVQFADPYCPEIRAAAMLPNTTDGGTMVVVDGPRFSTRAESRWHAAQGWSLVNMTGHPEAVLARELELCYATIALVTDLDAGVDVGRGVRAAEVFAEFEKRIGPFKEMIRATISRVSPGTTCPHCRVHEGVRLPFDLP